MYQILSFFDCKKTQVCTTGLTDLLNIELYNDNLKTLRNSPGMKHYYPWTNEIDEEMLENLSER